MKKSWFTAMERIDRLEVSAQSWVGTAFMPNALIKGGGVSCQKLVGAIYIEAGFFPAGFEIPEGPMDWGRANTESLIENFVTEELTGAGVMREVDRETEKIKAGDLIGFKIGGCIHHLGIALTCNRFVHCLRNEGVQLRRLDDATYMSRIEKVWRPIES